jgi:hypothetical protein
MFKRKNDLAESIAFLENAISQIQDDISRIDRVLVFISRHLESDFQQKAYDKMFSERLKLDKERIRRGEELKPC